MLNVTFRRNVSSRNQYMTWVADLQFAKEHELAWLLRWSLSRIVRLKDGTREACHGVLEWEAYEEWRGRERGKLLYSNSFIARSED
jgi:hypothetical protein